jgi:two-component SAPR family response regulator
MGTLAPYQPIHSGARILRDAPYINEWEKFDANSVQEYFYTSMRVFRKHLSALEDLSIPLTSDEESKLQFMMESITHARRLISDLQTNP